MALYKYAKVHHEYDIIHFSINQPQPKLIELFLSS